MIGLFVAHIKRALPLKQLALLLILSSLAITAGFILYANLSKDIEIIDNGKPIVVKTMGRDVGQALKRMNVSVGPYDYISTPVDTALDTIGLNRVYIKRAVPINLKIEPPIY